MRLEVNDAVGRGIVEPNFNTSKVRLEANAADPFRVGPDWISIPQRCDWKEHVSVYGDAGRISFQYLKGAIGSLHLAHLLQKAVVFQYLKGAIGRACPLSDRTQRRVQFQYLKGAIGRGEVLQIPRPLDPHFNTSKVRLEAAATEGAKPEWMNFNTSKVRLEGVALAPEK